MEWQTLEKVPDDASILLLCDGSVRDADGRLIPLYFTWPAWRMRPTSRHRPRWYEWGNEDEEFDPKSVGAIAWKPFPGHGIPEGEFFEFPNEKTPDR